MKYMLIIGMLLLTVFANAQQPAQTTKPDVILKVNGDELTGKVTEITDDEVKFVYANETLVYAIKKAEIQKITFSSGRIEFFNKPAAPAAGNANTGGAPASGESHHNKVAILPFGFVRDGQNAADEISLKVQNDCFSYMNKHAGQLSILDPRTSNAMLAKGGVTRENIKNYTMTDLCNLLGVEYVVEGTVLMNSTTQTSYSTANADVKDKDKDKKVSGSTFSSSQQNFETNLNLNIYNDAGATVYSQSRRSFFNTQDAYQNTLEYLLKRTPLYQK
ncbi:hypothetical protein [Chitinophaga barathri]|uniref:Uncharacterized protein n=1 Tax=Chitinophaga barathri TaxID=1647451 RepID=A0A3N4MS38_9BACT|nr:hypothetical protein [Chitinophaga barathri]RPD38203.1 hypothetical protein EG028_26450 [Chitinophaga barathri]